MRKSKKYIIYIHQEYLKHYSQVVGATTLKEQDEIRMKILNRIESFLKGDFTQSVLMCDSFTGSNGETTKSIEIYNIENGVKIQNLKELRQLIANQRGRGFERLKKNPNKTNLKNRRL